jgi:AcrB/AcrD/AcrF family
VNAGSSLLRQMSVASYFGSTTLPFPTGRCAFSGSRSFTLWARVAWAAAIPMASAINAVQCRVVVSGPGHVVSAHVVKADQIRCTSNRDFRPWINGDSNEVRCTHQRDDLGGSLALIPLALRGGQTGSEIQTPMAIVILCGLTTSTLLNMFVVPTLYLKYCHPPVPSLDPD